MNKFLRDRVVRAIDFLEIIIGVLLAIFITVSVIYLAGGLITVFTDSNKTEAFSSYLEIAFNFVIGIEFIKMLCTHTPETVIEVLLFAIARQLIVGHMSTIENLMGILAIAILFAARKFFLH